MRRESAIIRSVLGSSAFHVALLVGAFWVYDPVELSTAHYEEGVRMVLATVQLDPPPKVEPEVEPPQEIVRATPPKVKPKKRKKPPVEKVQAEPKPETVATPEKTPPREKIHVAKKAGVQKIGAKSKVGKTEAAMAPVADRNAAASAPSAVTRAPEAAPKGAQPSSKRLIRQYYGTLSSYLRRNYDYPRRARLASIEGTVLVEIVVDKDGNVIRHRIVRSSGHEILDNAALSSIADLRSVPRPPDGLPWTKRAIRVPFRYSLKT